MDDTPPCAGPGVDDRQGFAGKWRLASTHKSVHRLGTCGQLRLEAGAHGGHDEVSTSRTAGENPVDNCGRGVVDRGGPCSTGVSTGHLQSSEAQPTCCLMRLVSSVTWL